jgi:hypothetical protein
MIITNDLIKEATLNVQSNIGNRVALDSLNPASNVGLTNYWYDLSGNFNRATLDGITLNSLNTNEYAFSFLPQIDPTTHKGLDTSFASIVDSKSVDIAGWEITTEVWVKFTSLYGYNQNADPASWPLGINMNSQGLFGRWDSSSRNRPKNYSIQLTDSAIYFGHESGGYVYHEATYNTIDNFPGNWVQIVYKQDVSGWSVILNGDNLIASGTDVSILIPDNQPLTIGRRGDYDSADYAPYMFYGDMSVFNLWDRALTDAEIKNNYNFYSQRYI